MFDPRRIKDSPVPASKAKGSEATNERVAVGNVEAGTLETGTVPYLQWLVLVPVKGGLGGIVHPPIGSIYHLYTTYSPCLRLGVI